MESMESSWSLHGVYGVLMESLWTPRGLHGNPWGTVKYRVGWMTDQIFIWHMQGSGRLLTEYSISVCRGQVDY